MRSLNRFQISGYVNWHAENGNMYTVLVGVADDYFSKEDNKWVERRYGVFVRFSGRIAEGIADRINLGDQVIVQGKLTVYEKDGNPIISLFADDLIVVPKPANKDESRPAKNGEKPARSGSAKPTSSNPGSKKRVESIKNSDVDDDLWGDDSDEKQPW